MVTFYSNLKIITDKRFKGGIMVKTKFTTKLLSFGNNTGIEVPLNDL